MPESHLWLVNHLGGAFTLGTFHRKFKQLENTWDDAVSVKRLSASHWCAWAIGHDHRVYIYVRSSDVPVRVPETTFENQRWSPIHKFSKNGLITTDRPAWSNEAGTVYRPKESVRLPSAHWEWEGDWMIDDNLRGEVVGIEGWQYALDFPAVYTPEKHWNSFVRKRKWIRFRHFSSTDLWARISDMEVVEMAECFIDVSVGGFLMPSQPAGFLSVWAVTNNGHVYVRTNVNHDNPEGNSWQELNISDHIGIINISVGASNLVWAVTWDGNTLVRTQVTRNNIYGSSWVVVEHPDNSTRFMQVSVGRNSVWAISREGKVWFRKGTSGDDMFWNQCSAIGTSWVEMVGEMSQVAVSSNDQVFAIDLTGKNICFRTGVTSVDPTGKTWQPVSLHEDLTPLQKEGLLSEGDVCSCGDPDAPCTLHMEARPRLSSTTTSSSSISTATNVDENCDTSISPLQPFPIHITEPFSTFDSTSSWKQSEFMTCQNDVVNCSQVHSQTNDASPSIDVDSSSCTFLPTDCCGAVNEKEQKLLDKTANLQQGFSFHTITPSTTSQMSQHSSDEEGQLSQHMTATVVSATAHPQITETSPEGRFPSGGIPVDFIQKVVSAGDNRLDYTCGTAGKSDISYAIMEHTLSAKVCESVQKINSENYMITSCDNESNIEDKQIQKTSLIPFSNVTVDSVHLLTSGSNKLLAEMTSFDHRLSEINNFYECPDQSSTSHVLNGVTTLVSHGSFSNNELTFEHSDIRLPTHTTSADVFIKKTSPCISKSFEANSDSLCQQKFKNELNNDSNRFPLEESDSSVAIDNISFSKGESLTLESTLDYKYDTGQVIQKRKFKERRPKIIDLSVNDPNDDSILFKTFKSRRKRRVKLPNTTNDNVEKTDTASLSSDTSHGLTDVTELVVMNEDISISPESPEKETDVDFLDGNDAYPQNQDYPGSIYQSLSAHSSDFLSTFPSLSSFSGDYLNAVGFSTDSAFTMLDNLETAAMLPIYPQTQKKVTHAVNVKEHMRNPEPTAVPSGIDSPKHGNNSPKSFLAGRGRNSPKPVFPGSNRNNQNTVVAESYNNSNTVVAESYNNSNTVVAESYNNSNTVVAESYNNSNTVVAESYNNPNTVVAESYNNPNTVVAESYNNPNTVVAESYNNPNTVVAESYTSQKPVSTAGNINCSGIEGKTSHGPDFSPNRQSRDEAFEHSSQLDIFSNGSVEADIYCDSRVRHIHKGEIISSENSSVNLPNTNNIVENIPVPDCKNRAEVIISSTKTKVENKVESLSNSDTTLETCIPGVSPVSELVERCECMENSSINRQQLSKIEEFFNNKGASLDSTSNSEEIIDFVTDLLVSDDEVLETKSLLTEEKTSHEYKCSSEGDEIGELCQLQPILESPSSLNSNFHSQISINSSRSRASTLSNVTRDFNEEGEQNDIENTMQATTHLSYSSSQSFSTGNHPKSLPLGSMTPAKKVSRYLKSPSPSYVPVSNIIPIVPLTMAQPRLSWKWLDATSCVIDDPSTVEWLSNTSKEPRKKLVKITKLLREDIMKQLQDRNKREVHKFKDIEQAVKRTTWVKKARMHMFLYGRKSRWIACNVELEQGIGNLSEGSLTVHYQHKGKQKNTQMPLSEITCVKTSSDIDTPSEFVVYTPVTNIIHQPLMLKANSEIEAADWIGSLAAANAVVWNMNCPVTPGVIWSCTFIGDVFVSSTSSTPKHPSELSWGQHGGHTRLIETGPSGVTWALGFDRLPYVYNGGYGGAIHNGTSEMSDNTHQIMDHHKVFVYENQKWFPVIGWCCKGVFHNDFHWLTETGRNVETKEEVKLPSSKCQWISEWTVDFSTPGGVDTNGWQYSSSLYGPFVPRQHLRSSYRRRRWFRQYKITVFGPWLAAGSLGLVDLSVQIDPVASTSDPVVLWAVGANGDVLCRNGVSTSYPKGQSWIHVATYLDKPFKSISVGGSYRVWGIAGDGSAWFRPGVSPYNQAGSCWLQVVPPPPGNFLLHQVSAGAASVWAVDTGDNLWRRENITPTFPEGTGWELVASRVKRVSVGPRDQVWIIADASFSKIKHGAGVIYSRVGITSARPAGCDWEVVIGSGWAHVSVRGISDVKQEYPVSDLEDESSI